MTVPLRHLFGWLIAAFGSREELVLENLALRQQLFALHPERPGPRFGILDKLFWVILRRIWSGWRRSVILVRPDTVVRWHRADVIIDDLQDASGEDFSSFKIPRMK
jgi:putative transposase